MSDPIWLWWYSSWSSSWYVFSPKTVQYNACSTITSAIRGTSKERFYQELGLESLQLRLWYRKLRMLYKIYKTNVPNTFLNWCLNIPLHMLTRNAITFLFYKIRQKLFKNSFFPPTIFEWNNLDLALPNSKRFGIFKNSILKALIPSPSSVFLCENHKGIRSESFAWAQIQADFSKFLKSNL